MYTLHDLAIAHVLRVGPERGARVRCLTFSLDFQYLYVGTHDGRLIVCTNPKMRLTMLSTAMDRTFIGMIT